jgi:chromate transporter
MAANERPSLIQLFLSFLRLGISSFGGPSMVVYIRKYTVQKKNWIEGNTFDNGVALSQMIPGATAIQSAAYVGLKTRGIIGAAVCFISFALPAFILMILFAALYSYTSNIPAVVSVFGGLQAIIVAIVANATFSFGKNTLKDWRSYAITISATVLFAFKIHPIFVILFAALAGFIIFKAKQKSSLQNEKGQQIHFPLKAVLLLLTITVAGFVFLFIFNRPLFQMAILMFRIDLFSFGGGFAAVPLMHHEFVDVRNWLDAQTFMNGIVLGQITPGPIVITATFVGYMMYGIVGGTIATISIFLPSFLLLMIIAPLFEKLKSSRYFSKIITGILCSFVGLLLTVTVRFGIDVDWNIFHIILAAVAFIALLKKVDILWVVGIGTLSSVIFFYLF